MYARLLFRSLLVLLLPATLAGAPQVWATPAPVQLLPGAGSENVVSAPRQSLPAPVHDESICAFCQAAAFAPHAAAPACGLVEAAGAVHHELVSRNDRLTHSGSLRPPRSRAPPTLRDA